MNFKSFLTEKFQNNKKLLDSFKWRLLQILFKQGTTALMFFIATYFLTKKDMGIYNYVSSALLLLALITDFGISTSASRYIALYETEDKEKVKKVFFNSGIVILGASVLVAVVIIIFRDCFFLEESREYLMYALPMIFIYPMTSLMDGIYRGLKRFKKLSILTMLNSVVGIGASYFLVTSFGLLGAIISPLVFFTSYLILLIAFYDEYQFKIEKKVLRDIVTYAFFFGVAAIGHYLFSKVNILILGQYDFMEEIAVYELVTKFNTEFILPFVVLGAVIAPNVVEIFSKNEYRQLRTLFKKLLLLTVLMGIIFIPIAMLLSKGLIGLIFPVYLGEVFNSLLLPVVLTHAVVVPVVVINAGIITSTGHAKLMAIQNILAGIVNVILNILVIGKYGYIGVVWVTFTVQLISTIVLYLVYYSKLKN